MKPSGSSCVVRCFISSRGSAARAASATRAAASPAADAFAVEDDPATFELRATGPGPRPRIARCTPSATPRAAATRARRRPHRSSWRGARASTRTSLAKRQPRARSTAETPGDDTDEISQQNTRCRRSEST